MWKIGDLIQFKAIFHDIPVGAESIGIIIKKHNEEQCYYVYWFDTKRAAALAYSCYKQTYIRISS